MSAARMVIRDGQIMFKGDDEAAFEAKRVLMKLVELVETAGVLLREDDRPPEDPRQAE